jgi:integrase
MNHQQQTEHRVLDRATVAKLPLPDGKTDHIEWDRDLKGFGFRLRGDGGRLLRAWVVQYRIKGKGQSRRFKIGDYPTVNADQAREKAKTILAKVQLGEDPQGAREAERQRASRTLRWVADEYLKMKELQVQRGQFRASSYRVTRLYLSADRYFGPLHRMPVDDVARADVATRLNVINRDSGSVTAGRARAALRSMYVWAMEQGYAVHNPIIGTKNPDDAPSRDLVLSDVELAHVWRAAGDDAFGKIIRLLILTGCRREEIGGLRWSEIPPDAGTITLPKERTKNKHEHVLPITPLAMAIIGSVRRIVGRDHLFGDSSATGFTGWDAAKKALDERLVGKLKGKSAAFRLHDLRRSLATWLAEHGDVEPHIIEAILNHYSGHKGGISGIYNRAKYARQMRAALNQWDDHLRVLLEGGTRKIVPFSTALHESA